jgi:ketosteroid isomerase-like protein
MRDNGHDLAWVSAASGLAPAGDMGFTTGPYRVLNRESGGVTSTGTFVTIWRRHGGQWRIAFDTGIPDPPPPASPTPSPS